MCWSSSLRWETETTTSSWSPPATHTLYHGKWTFCSVGNKQCKLSKNWWRQYEWPHGFLKLLVINILASSSTRVISMAWYLACTTNNKCRESFIHFIRRLRSSRICKSVAPGFPNPWLWKQKYYFLVKTQLLRELFGESCNQNICFPLATLDAEMPNIEPTLPACLCHHLIHSLQISHHVNNRKLDTCAPNGGKTFQVVV